MQAIEVASFVENVLNLLQQSSHCFKQIAESKCLHETRLPSEYANVEDWIKWKDSSSTMAKTVSWINRHCGPPFCGAGRAALLPLCPFVSQILPWRVWKVSDWRAEDRGVGPPPFDDLWLQGEPGGSAISGWRGGGIMASTFVLIRGPWQGGGCERPATAGKCLIVSGRLWSWLGSHPSGWEHQRCQGPPTDQPCTPTSWHDPPTSHNEPYWWLMNWRPSDPRICSPARPPRQNLIRLAPLAKFAAHSFPCPREGVRPPQAMLKPS